MRKKIIALILFFILSITSITSIAVDNTDIINEDVVKTIFKDDISLILYKAPLFYGVNLDIENNGETKINNIEWSFRSKASITGTGVFINENLQEGLIDEIGPGEKITLKFRFLKPETKSPLGLGNIYMNASAKIDDVSVRTQQRAFIFGLFIIMFRDTYMDIKPAEAFERLKNEEFDLIIDVVGLDIYSLGHLPGAVNYVWADGTLNSKISELDPSLTYLVYCHTDPPSTASAQALVDAGFKNIYRLEGNFAAWKNAGYPVET